MAATLRKWLHMNNGDGGTGAAVKCPKKKKNKKGANQEIPTAGNIGVQSPSKSRCQCRQQQQQQQQQLQPHPRGLGCAAINVARRLLARARSAVTRVSPAANNVVGNNAQQGPIVATPASIQQQQQQQQPTSNTNTMAAATTKSRSSSKKCVDVTSRSVAHEKMVRTRRLMREFRDLSSRQATSDPRNCGFTVELVDDNLYEWHVKLYGLDPESDLWRDLRDTATPYVLLAITFPKNFPFAPPFMRVVSPRIEKGFVMEGGAICMELLTPAGWASAYTVEAIVMQFAASVVKGHGRIVRKVGKGVKGQRSSAEQHLANYKSNGGNGVIGGGGGGAGSGSTSKTFSRKAAEASFRSLVKTHEKFGWVTPGLSEG